MASCAVDLSAQPDYYVHGGDNSAGCWATNYSLSACIVVYVVLLVVRRKSALLTEHTRLFFVGKYAMLCVSVLVAGFVHQGIAGNAGDNSDGANPALWAITEVTLVLSGACTTCCAFSMLTELDNTLRNVIFYAAAAVAGVALSVWVFFLDDSFAISGALGEILPDLALVVAAVVKAWSCCGGRINLPEEERGPFSLGAAVTIAGVLVILIGGGVQVGLGSACGVPCPADCPLPAPAFNHNALFHVLQTLGMAVLAGGMDRLCGLLEAVALQGKQ